MLGSKVLQVAVHESQHQPGRRLATRHVAKLRGLVDDFVHREHREVRELDLHHRGDSNQRGADRHSNVQLLAQRDIAYPGLAELLEQSAPHRPDIPQAEVLSIRDNV